MWEIIQYIGTPLSLLAFTIAAAVYAYSIKLKGDVNLIKTIPRNQRISFIEKKMETYKIILNEDSLTDDQKFELIKLSMLGHASKLKNLSITIIILAIVLAIVIIVTDKDIFNNNTIPEKNHKTSLVEKNLNNLVYEVSELRSYFMGAEHYLTDSKKVRNQAPILAERLMSIDDSYLSTIIYQIIKYHFAAMSYMMAATVHGASKEENIEYCSKSLSQLKIVENLIKISQDLESKGELPSEAIDYIRNNKIIANNKYGIAVCLAVHAKYEVKGVSVSQAKTALDRVPVQLWEDYPPSENPFLKWLIDNTSTK